MEGKRKRRRPGPEDSMHLQI
jgi:hypothetical protein